MSSLPDLASHFARMEAFLEAQPEGTNAEIARGVYLMSPRAGLRHVSGQVRLAALLDERFGRARRTHKRGTLRSPGPSGNAPDWLFAMEPEIKSETAFSRMIPDLAGWQRSTTGWPDPERNPITLTPEWVAEFLSVATEAFDRGPKKEAYGMMGVATLWILDAKKRTVETFVNVRGAMIAGPSFAPGQPVSAPPFETFSIPPGELFPL